MAGKAEGKSTNKKHPASSDIPPFTCKRNATHMIIPKTRYPLNALFATVKAQDVCFARKGVDAWADKYHYTPARKSQNELTRSGFPITTRLTFLSLHSGTKMGHLIQQGYGLPPLWMPPLTQ
ncbi:MAG: hypothetical protein LIO95_06095 [Clostridiales bacterium]|nr:hypothetical protein [Clostridiales bacterium]